MSQNFVQSLKFTYVDFREDPQYPNDRLIYFKLNDVLYLLLVSLKDNLFYPERVVHLRNESGHPNCFFCEKEMGGPYPYFECSLLEEYKTDLFYRLITYPRVRLHFLYLPYAERVEHGEII